MYGPLEIPCWPSLTRCFSKHSVILQDKSFLLIALFSIPIMKNQACKWSSARGCNMLCSDDAACHFLDRFAFLLHFFIFILSPPSSVQQTSESWLCTWYRALGIKLLRWSSFYTHGTVECYQTQNSMPGSPGLHTNRKVWETDQHIC